MRIFYHVTVCVTSDYKIVKIPYYICLVIEIIRFIKRQNDLFMPQDTKNEPLPGPLIDN